VPNRSHIYLNIVDSKSGKPRMINVPYNDRRGQTGALLCTASDLLQFGNMVLYSHLGMSPNGSKKGFLRQETMKEMLTPHPLSSPRSQSIGYGLGFVVSTDDAVFCGETEEHKFFGHTGLVEGATACLYIEPQSEIVVVIMCNTESSIPHFKVASRIAQYIMDIPSISSLSMS